MKMNGSRSSALNGYPRLSIAISVAALFAVNAYICQELFWVEITRQTGSIEAAFISFSRWLMDHAGDWQWMPMWVNGAPVRQIYNPGLQVSVAELARLAHWPAT